MSSGLRLAALVAAVAPLLHLTKKKNVIYTSVHMLTLSKNQSNSSLVKSLPLHTAGAREIWIDQSGFSSREKLYCPDVNVS